MPETSNSLVSKPALQSVSDVVKNVELKRSNCRERKGYTKSS